MELGHAKACYAVECQSPYSPRLTNITLKLCFLVAAALFFSLSDSISIIRTAELVIQDILAGTAGSGPESSFFQ